MQKIRLTIARKMGVMKAVLLLLFVASLFFVRFQTNRATTAIKAQGNTFSRWETANAVSRSFAQVAYWWTEYMVSGQMGSERNAKAAQEQLTSLLANLQGTEQDNSLSSKTDAYVKSMDEAVVAYLDEDNRVRGNVLAKQARQIADEIEEELDALITEAQTNAKTAGHMVIGANAQISNVSLFLLVGIPALGICLAWLFSRSITRPIKTLVGAASQVADGDLNVSVETNTNDEVSSLGERFNVMVGNIRAANEALQAEKASVEQKVEEAIAESEAQKQYLSERVEIMLTEMERFASGNLTVRLEAEKDDEIGKLFSGFNRALENMCRMIQQVSEVVSSTASAATEISSSTQQLAAGAEEQSAQADEVAAAVEQMSRTIVENSRNAQQTAESTASSGAIATEGGEIVQRTVEKIQQIAKVVSQSTLTVEKLGKSSTQIGEIVSVIDDIADQTNLLALNAAIEAARAGEQGRGFAVVADEVRKLAERTTQATHQIAGMIKTIQSETQDAVQAMNRGNEEVIEGITLTDHAGVALDNIVSSTQGVVDMVNQIAVASEEQSATSEEISKNVEAISSVASESAAGVAQIAHTASDLNQLTLQLQSLASQFTIGKSGTEDLLPVPLGTRAGKYSQQVDSLFTSESYTDFK